MATTSKRSSLWPRSPRRPSPGYTEPPMSDPIDRTPAGLVRRYFDACNERRLDDLDLVFPPTFISHLRVGDVIGLHAFKELMLQVYSAFPDVLWTAIEEIHA